MKKLKLGIIGMSEGNGHPYSWSAIVNGYDPEEMKKCPFPVIPDYLAKQKFPDDFLTDIAEVTHVLTLDTETSKSIAHASRITNIAEHPLDLIGKVDAVLLARDDAKNHVEMAMPYINAGIPVFIDKPFALSIHDAQSMLNAQKFDQQIFTCSSLRYANELILSTAELNELGDIVYVEGSVMKQWETYGIHILEPLVAQLPHRGKLLSVDKVKFDDIHIVLIKWEHCAANLKVTGHIPSPMCLSFYGKNGNITKHFSDSFSCFRASLKNFIEQVSSRKQAIPRSETLELVEIIEKGIC